MSNTTNATPEPQPTLLDRMVTLCAQALADDAAAAAAAVTTDTNQKEAEK